MERLFDPPDLTVIEPNFAVCLLGRPALRLEDAVSLLGKPLPSGLSGAVYALFYGGDFPIYGPLARIFRERDCVQPIYVGGTSERMTNALRHRLAGHLRDIQAAEGLSAESFLLRFFPVSRNWAYQAREDALERFKPLWNCLLTGFGSNSAGRNRSGQRASAWDVVHSGRRDAESRSPHPEDREKLESAAYHYLIDQYESIVGRPWSSREVDVPR